MLERLTGTPHVCMLLRRTAPGTKGAAIATGMGETLIIAIDDKVGVARCEKVKVLYNVLVANLQSWVTREYRSTELERRGNAYEAEGKKTVSEALGWTNENVSAFGICALIGLSGWRDRIMRGGVSRIRSHLR